MAKVVGGVVALEELAYAERQKTTAFTLSLLVAYPGQVRPTADLQLLVKVVQANRLHLRVYIIAPVYENLQFQGI